MEVNWLVGWVKSNDSFNHIYGHIGTRQKPGAGGQSPSIWTYRHQTETQSRGTIPFYMEISAPDRNPEPGDNPLLYGHIGTRQKPGAGGQSPSIWTYRHETETQSRETIPSYMDISARDRNPEPGDNPLLYGHIGMRQKPRAGRQSPPIWTYRHETETQSRETIPSIWTYRHKTETRSRETIPFYIRWSSFRCMEPETVLYTTKNFNLLGDHWYLSTPQQPKKDSNPEPSDHESHTLCVSPPNEDYMWRKCGVWNNQWSGGLWAAENEQDHLNLTEDGSAGHHVQTKYLLVQFGRTIWTLTGPSEYQWIFLLISTPVYDCSCSITTAEDLLRRSEGLVGLLEFNVSLSQ